jgi:flap endonuclease-1
MGVNLSPIIQREEISFSDLKGKKIALDAFNTLYQFLSSIRGPDGTPLQDSQGRITSHLQGLFSRSLNLMAKGLKLVYVFDGAPPEMKSKEIESRVSRKEDAEKKFADAVESEDLDAMYKYSKQFVKLDSAMVEEAKELVKALGLPCIQAPSEADAQITYMCKNGDVDYAASTDYDCVLLGVPSLIRNLTLSQKRRTSGGKYVSTFLELIKTRDVLAALDLTQDQLVTLGILVGTDYNPGGVKGLGPKKSLKLVKEKSIEEIFAEVSFDWKKIFSWFKEPSWSPDYSLSFGTVDVEKVKAILVDKHEFSEERIVSLIDKYLAEVKKNDHGSLNEFF